MDLGEWTIHYVKYKDSIARKLLKHEVKYPFVVFTFKDKIHSYLLQEQLDSSLFEKIKDKEYKTAVCNYTMQNLDFVIKNWTKLSAIKNFWVLFADPKQDKKLLLNPQTHSYVADPETLEDGLKAMFDPEMAASKPEKKEKGKKKKDPEEEFMDEEEE